ncbi:hypothetical protein QQ045_032546 [Rhodiola kirilowii]
MSTDLKKLDDVKEVFNRFDANGDDLISATELAGVLKALGTDSSPDEITRMTEQLDDDRDGFINLSEFASFQRISLESDAGVTRQGCATRLICMIRMGTG